LQKPALNVKVKQGNGYVKVWSTIKISV
jgi:hypothetical protein